MKSARRGTIALLSDGHLYGWGHNIFGQLGVRPQEFVRTDFVNLIPMPVNSKYMRPDEQIVDFDLGYQTLCFYTNQNRVYFSGMDLAWVPYLLHEPQPNERIVKVIASQNSVGFVNDQNELFVTNNFLEPLEKFGQGFVKRVNVNRVFDGGRVADIGGSYRIHYAIVEQ